MLPTPTFSELSAVLAPRHDAREVCSDPACAILAARASTGRWFITMGHPNFNGPANNGAGFATEAGARASVARLLRRIGRR